MASHVKIVPMTSWIDTPPSTPIFKNLSSRLVYALPWLDKISGPLQKSISSLYGEPGQPAYKIKDLLNGVWLGHVIHPIMVTIPLGSWTATVLLDALWLSSEDEGVAKSADLTLWLGLAGAFGAVATGLTQWIDTDGPEQRTGMFHALLNSSVTLLNISSAFLRLAGKRRSAITLASTAYAVSLYGAYLGGELSYSSGIGVNHVAWEAGSDDFVAVLNEKDLQPGTLTRVDAAGIPAVLLKDGKTIHALAATCSHLGAPLDEGTYKDGILYCPWHNSGFRMADGSVAHSPAVCSQPTFAVRVRDGKIELRRLEHV